MSVTTFESKTRLGPRRYELDGNRLRITGEAPFKKVDLNVDLREIAPRFQRLRCIGHRVIRNCVMYIVGIALLASLLSRFGTIPTAWILAPAALLIFSFLRVLLTWCRSIEVEPFHSHAGALVFEILRERGEEAKFDAFIESLHAAVLACNSNVIDTSPAIGSAATDQSSQPAARHV